MPGDENGARRRRLITRFLRDPSSNEAPPGDLEASDPGALERRREVFERLLTPELPAEESAAAQRVWNAFRKGLEASADDFTTLEAIVERVDRPVLFVQNDAFTAPASGTWASLGDIAADLSPAIRVTCRINARGLAVGYAGTGVLVGPRLVATNRHVARLLTDRIGAGPFNLTREAKVDFLQEHEQRKASAPVGVAKVKMVHPYWDFALLELDADAGRAPLKLSSRFEFIERRPLVVIGYPAAMGVDPILESRVFGDRYGVKRLQPGVMRPLFKDYEPDPSGQNPDLPYPKVDPRTHDASTLGGNSGSGVFDQSGVLIGLHFAGVFFERNYFVPATELSRDPRVREVGDIFDAPHDATLKEDPRVVTAWRPYERRGVVPRTTSRARPPDNEAAAAPPAGARVDWVERGSLASLLEVSTEAAAQALGTAPARFGEQAAAALAAVDGDERPELVIVPDFAGSHLADEGLGWRRVWLSPDTFSVDASGDRLALDVDGLREQHAGARIRPDGVLRFLYGEATRAWSRAGFFAHEFGYDWRRSLVEAADGLARLVEELAARRPTSRVALVAHGMGAAVACLAAHRRPSVLEKTRRAVLVGPSWRGGVWAAEAIVEGSFLSRKLFLLAAEARWPAAVVATFPSLWEMLPDPADAPEFARLYERDTWRALGVNVRQSRLDESLALKAALRGSALLDRADFIVSADVGTSDRLVSTTDRLGFGARTTPGDGIASAREAMRAGSRHWLAAGDRAALLGDPRVVGAVAALLTRGNTDALPRLAAAPEGVVAAPREMRTILESLPDPFRDAAVRLREEFSGTDLRWLFEASLRAPTSA